MVLTKTSFVSESCWKKIPTPAKLGAATIPLTSLSDMVLDAAKSARPPEDSASKLGRNVTAERVSETERRAGDTGETLAGRQPCPTSAPARRSPREPAHPRTSPTPGRRVGRLQLSASSRFKSLPKPLVTN